MNDSKSATIRVWDPVVRIGHWTLVTTFFIAYFTEDDFITARVWAGYVLTAVVLFRIIWGFTGTRHARFTDFVRSPVTVAAYLKSLIKGKARHYTGHNPAGGIMIMLMLFSLVVTVYTGLELYAIEDNAGPFAAVESQDAGAIVMNVLVPAAYAAGIEGDDDDSSDDGGGHSNVDRDEDAEDFWEELHEFFANFTLFLVFLHVTGVIVSSRLHDENLVKAMLTGKKVRR